jgi:hypothetical protein
MENTWRKFCYYSLQALLSPARKERSGMEFNHMEIDWEYLFERLERFLDLGEEYLTRSLVEYAPAPQMFNEYIAFRWIKNHHTGYLEEIARPGLQSHADLTGLDPILENLCRNTAQFAHGLPSNHVLLRGEPGTGKRSAIVGLLEKFQDQGLRMIEIRSDDLQQLPIMVSRLRNLPFRFILYCREVFPCKDPACFRELRNLLQGNIETCPENLRIYATMDTSLQPLHNTDNAAPDTLAAPEGPPQTAPFAACAGFGVVLDLPLPQRAAYLDICRHLAKRHNLSVDDEEQKRAALLWAERRGRFSGLVARQFIDDLRGRLALDRHPADTPS